MSDRISPLSEMEANMLGSWVITEARRERRHTWNMDLMGKSPYRVRKILNSFGYRIRMDELLAQIGRERW